MAIKLIMTLLSGSSIMNSTTASSLAMTLKKRIQQNRMSINIELNIKRKINKPSEELLLRIGSFRSINGIRNKTEYKPVKDKFINIKSDF